MSTKAEALEAIYGRLASAPTFHPANADLFTDWTVQGGDILTVHTNNVPHLVPVYSMQMKWTGKPKVTVQSTGDEEMPSIETLAQQKSSTRGSSYRRGIAAAESDQEIHQAIFSEDGYMHTYIDVTASGIKTEVGTAISNMAQSVIEQTATYIRTEVENAASSISATVIEQTADYVRTEVASVASGIAWTVVTETMSGIEQRVSQRSRVFVQWEDPSTTHTDLIDGDLWYKKPNSTTWNALSGKKWNEISENKWKDLYGIVHYVWKNGAWQKVADTATILENDTYIEHDREHWAVYSRQLDLQGETFNSNLNVTAREISSQVSTTKAGLLSTIAQTATNINTHVEDVKNGLQSNIEQTASSITTSVSAAKSALYSTIEQTATQIRAEVVDVKNGLESTITQTASEIRLSVASAKSDLSSNIIQTASSIRTEVNASKSQIYSSITQTASSIRLEVANSISDVRSSITQTASEIRAEVSSSKSSIWSSITQTSTQISLKVGKGEVISSINQTAESITISASKVNLDGYVKATDITTTLITTKLADASNVNAKKITLTNNGYIVLPTGDGTISLTGATAVDIIRGLKVVSSGNNYKLQAITYGDSSWHDLPNSTFSRATSLSGAWSSGTYTVTASPQGNTNSTTLRYASPSGSVSRSGKVVSRTFKIQYGSDDEHLYDTGFNPTISIDATSVYNQGQTDKTVSDIRFAGYGSPYWENSVYKMNITTSADYNIGGTTTKTVAADVTTPYQDGIGSVSVIYDSNVRQAIPYANGAWTGVTGLYIGDMLDDSYNSGVSAGLANHTASSIVPYYWGGTYYDSTLGAWQKALYVDVTYSNGDSTRLQTAFWLNVQDAYDYGAAQAYPNSLSITNASWHSISGNVYYGKLYYWDDDDQSYSPVVNQNRYWYYSATRKSGTTTVHY